MTLEQVEDCAAQSNRNRRRFRVAGGQEYLIQGLGRVSSVEEIGQIAVTAREGRPIFVRDVATVQIGAALKRGEGSHKAEPAVILGIQKQPGANTLALTRTLDRTLDDIERTLPQGMHIDRQIFRQADFIERLWTTCEPLSRRRSAGHRRRAAVPVNVRAAFITLLQFLCPSWPPSSA
jgi:Cu/Ag efflux pump CusA